MELAAYILILVSLLFFLLLASYPLFAYVISFISENKVNKSESHIEPVSIIISCYNEEEYILDKIISLIHENEWITGSELIIVSSGATDNTNVILEEFSNNEKLVLIIKQERYSKIDGVNLAVSKATNELLIFSDCRQKIEPGSIKALIHNFNDPNIGTVTGTLVDTKDSIQPSIFRSIFNFISIKDSSASSCLNVYGALYAQRKSVYRKIPNNLLFDDLFVVVSTLNQKKRLIQEKKAIIYDYNFGRYYEKERISRLARGLLIFLFCQFKLITSMPFGSLIRFLIYKYAKLMMPFFLTLFIIGITIFIINGQRINLLVGVLIFSILPFFFTLSRKFMLLFIRINYYFLKAITAYLLGFNRSNNWGKSQITKKS